MSIVDQHPAMLPVVEEHNKLAAEHAELVRRNRGLAELFDEALRSWRDGAKKAAEEGKLSEPQPVPPDTAGPLNDLIRRQQDNRDRRKRVLAEIVDDIEGQAAERLAEAENRLLPARKIIEQVRQDVTGVLNEVRAARTAADHLNPNSHPLEGHGRGARTATVTDDDLLAGSLVDLLQLAPPPSGGPVLAVESRSPFLNDAIGRPHKEPNKPRSTDRRVGEI